MRGFATQRLVIAPLVQNTALKAALPELVTPEVTAHLPPDLQSDQHADGASWLARLQKESQVFTVSDASGVMGLLTLHHASDQQIMLGYLFSKRAWGKGFATELVRGWVADLKASGWQGQVKGGVDPGNPASARVLEKAGFVAADPPFYVQQI